MARYRTVSSNERFAALEERVLEGWRQNDIFHKTLQPP